jgi:hypothetical protein
MAGVPATIRSARSHGRCSFRKGISAAIQAFQKAAACSQSPLTPSATSRSIPCARPRRSRPEPRSPRPLAQRSRAGLPGPLRDHQVQAAEPRSRPRARAAPTPAAGTGRARRRAAAPAPGSAGGSIRTTAHVTPDRRCARSRSAEPRGPGAGQRRFPLPLRPSTSWRTSGARQGSARSPGQGRAGSEIFSCQADAGDLRVSLSCTGSLRGPLRTGLARHPGLFAAAAGWRR